MQVKLSYRTYEKKQFFALMVRRARMELKRFPLEGKVLLHDSGSELVPVAEWLLEQCHVDVLLRKRESSANLFSTCAEDEAAERLRTVLQGAEPEPGQRFMRTFLLEEIRALRTALKLSGAKHVPDHLLLDFERSHPGTVFGLIKSMHQLASFRRSRGKS